MLVDDDGEEVFLGMPLAAHAVREHALLHDSRGGLDPGVPVRRNEDAVVLDFEPDGAGRGAPDPGQPEERVVGEGAEGADVSFVARQAVEVVAHLVESEVAVGEGDALAVEVDAGAASRLYAVRGSRWAWRYG